MNLRAILALIRTDLHLYVTDRRAVIVGILMPICIAGFFGYVFGGVGQTREAGKLAIALVDEDQSTVSRAIVADIANDKMLDVSIVTRAEAEEQVRKGAKSAAAVFPKGFGEQSVDAFFRGVSRPRIDLLVDPSQQMSARIVEGLLAQYATQDISREAINGAMGRATTDRYLAQLEAEGNTEANSAMRTLLRSARELNELNARQRPGEGAPRGGFEFNMPYEVSSTLVAGRNDVPYNSYAHAFAGMSVQFILFAGIDAGVMLLLLRQRGIWQRIRAAPIRKGEFVLARMSATALISLFQLAMIYLAAMLIFGVRVAGSWPGLLLVGIAFSVLNAGFGLMLATLGRSPGATRGIASMVMLLLLMLGGAWVPSFVFPRWLQQASLYTPTRWAVDGLDAMTWRGLSLGDALPAVAVLTGAALVCLAVAAVRFRWEE